MKKIEYFPELRQTFHYDCGASALQSVLVYYGFDLYEQDIIKFAKTNRLSGTELNDLAKTARHFGLQCKSGKLTLNDLRKNIDRQIPTIILIQAQEKPKTTPRIQNYWHCGHYVIPVAYDKKRIYFEDPSFSVRTFLTDDELIKRWHGEGKNKNGIFEKYVNYGIIFSRKDGKPAIKPKPVNMVGII